MPPVRKWIKTAAVWVGSLAALVLAIAWLSGAFHRAPAPAPAPGPGSGERLPRQVADPGEVVAVQLEQSPQVTSVVGSVESARETTISSRLSARVKAMHVVAGQQVVKGDLLVEMDRDDINAQVSRAQSQVEAAQARLTQAESDLEKLTLLRQQQAATQRELDDTKRAASVARAEVQSAQHALEEVNSQLQYASVVSPIDGIVIDKQVEVGDLALPGAPLVTLYDPKSLQFVASVPEQLAMRMKVGQSVGVMIEAMGKTCDATVSEIVPQAALQSRSFEVKATGPCPPGVFSGMFGRMLIDTGTQQRLLLPADAVRRVGQLEMVKVVDDSGAVERRYVRSGQTLGDQVEILSGLRDGERVLQSYGDEVTP
ncbi:MAG: efflux RND transporter periplasmic adaptor subunit [Phycisphaeraceae bacterium]|nr:efflux RND transporter periplasmic adaptor subunit [Phycisphaeraceae bacterium]